ncbi:hypothetical protein GCM10023259_039470 [Thermocatellispora tengchongensis]
MLGAHPDERAETWTAVEDVDDAYRRWFDDHACAAVVVRPDRYVYGSAPSATSLRYVLRSCLSDLRTDPIATT